MEHPQFNQPILVFSDLIAALFNQELTELFIFLALESMGFQPHFAYSRKICPSVFLPARRRERYAHKSKTGQGAPGGVPVS